MAYHHKPLLAHTVGDYRKMSPAQRRNLRRALVSRLGADGALCVVFLHTCAWADWLWDTVAEVRNRRKP